MAALPGIVAKLLAERGAGARQARLHGAHGAADDLGHLRFGQALEVEQNHGPGVLGEAHQRALDLPGDDLPEPVQLDVSQEPVLLSGAERPRIDGVEAADGRVVALAAVLADERVAEDPEEPRFEVGARRELACGREGAHVGLQFEVRRDPGPGRRPRELRGSGEPYWRARRAARGRSVDTGPAAA